jgi:hypothetical protein
VRVCTLTDEPRRGAALPATSPSIALKPHRPDLQPPPRFGPTRRQRDRFCQVAGLTAPRSGQPEPALSFQHVARPACGRAAENPLLGAVHDCPPEDASIRVTPRPVSGVLVSPQGLPQRAMDILWETTPPVGFAPRCLGRLPGSRKRGEQAGEGIDLSQIRVILAGASHQTARG